MPTVSTRPDRALQLDDLPERIAAHLRTLGHEQTFQYALKTALKPDATVPIVWAVLTTKSLLLCTTHARRGVWKEYLFPAINSITKTSDGFSDSVVLQVISASLDVPDLLLPLPVDTEKAWTNEFLSCYRKLRKQDAQ